MDSGRRDPGPATQAAPADQPRKPGHVHDDIERVLLSEEEIRAGIDRLAERLTREYAGREFTALGVLKGSCIFLSDLVRRLPIPLAMAFACTESYRDATRPGELDVRLFPRDEEIRGANLLLIDDILDSGRTLHRLTEELRARGADEVRTCVFLDKPARREVALQADYRCFEVEDEFLVGYGLDLAGRYRNLPYVGTVRPEVLERRALPGAVNEARGDHGV